MSALKLRAAGPDTPMHMLRAVQSAPPLCNRARLWSNPDIRLTTCGAQRNLSALDLAKHHELTRLVELLTRAAVRVRRMQRSHTLKASFGGPIARSHTPTCRAHARPPALKL